MNSHSAVMGGNVGTAPSTFFGASDDRLLNSMLLESFAVLNR